MPTIFKQPLNKYGSIEQFRNVVSNVIKTSEYNNEPVPIITFNGTVKLHGTNCGIGYKPGFPIWAQSKRRILNTEKIMDNAGFCEFVMSNEEIITTYIESLDLSLEKNEHCIFFGEWCGEGIQKGVAISNLSKRFIIFEIQKVTPVETGSGAGCETGRDMSIRTHYPISFVKSVMIPEHSIWNIYLFKTYSIDIDFKCPRSSQNALIKMTTEVENECPVGKYFGVSGIGEGIVWRGDKYIFKVKGEKHSVTKVKKLASVDVEKLTSINKFIEYAVTETRLQQAWVESVTVFKMTSMGNFLRWMVNDIIKEETDTLLSNNLTIKQVSKNISLISCNWFKVKLNQVVFD
jgi:hypothetical protein